MQTIYSTILCVSFLLISFCFFFFCWRKCCRILDWLFKYHHHLRILVDSIEFSWSPTKWINFIVFLSIGHIESRDGHSNERRMARKLIRFKINWTQIYWCGCRPFNSIKSKFITNRFIIQSELYWNWFARLSASNGFFRSQTFLIHRPAIDFHWFSVLHWPL